MNLILDLGNTFGKIAACEDTEIIESVGYPKITDREIAYFIECYNLKGAIVSSVVNHSREIVDYLNNLFEVCIELNSTTPLPIINKYTTPDTLGYDRIAAAVGAYTIFPDSNVLVIDAGTAMTYDIVSEKGEFLGGSIAPGIEMRLKALNKFTNQLPLLEKPDGEVNLIGESTTEAILSGVVNGILFEIDGYISSARSEFANLQIVMTGGDANYFEKKVKNSIFVNSNLNIIGLNRILEYNAGEKI